MEFKAKAEAAIHMILKGLLVYRWWSADVYQSSLQTSPKKPSCTSPGQWHLHFCTTSWCTNTIQMYEEVPWDHSSWKLHTFSGDFLVCTYLCKHNFYMPPICRVDLAIWMDLAEAHGVYSQPGPKCPSDRVISRMCSI